MCAAPVPVNASEAPPGADKTVEVGFTKAPSLAKASAKEKYALFTSAPNFITRVADDDPIWAFVPRATITGEPAKAAKP
jgi:hypothetical protein